MAEDNARSAEVFRQLEESMKLNAEKIRQGESEKDADIQKLKQQITDNFS